MQREYNFAVEEIKRIEFSDYDEQEFSIARLGFISTRPNSHGIGIDEDCLRASAPSALGMWIVAKMFMGDATTHEADEHIVGMIPKDQDIEFVEDNNGYLRAYCDAIISKRYAADFCEIFEKDNERAVSIEAKFTMKPDDENEAESFSIKGVTVLGKRVKPSCPESDIAFVRFSESDAEDYYRARHGDAVSNLTKFVETRKQSMAEKKYVSHPINTSKDAVYTGEWDGNKAKQDLIKEKNYKSLAPKVCLNLEKGWEDREVTKLGYPVMGLFDGEWRYSTRALASALAYAKQNDEQEVLNKLKEIYDELDLNEEGKEDDEKMSKEVAFAAVDLNLMWTKINDELRARNYDWRWYIDGIFEQDNKKFVIIRNDDGDRFRINFSYTEDGLFMDDEMVKVDIEFVETDDIKRFSCPEEFKHLMGEEGKSEDEPDEKDAIIMQKDAEIDELRKELDELKAYKAAIEEKEIAKRVEDILDEVKDYLDADKYQELRAEGLACGKDEIDAFGNKVKAQCFNAFKKAAKKDADKIFAFSKPIEIQKKDMSTMNVWDRIKENY
nr:MAG TPA: hypothetical protein [Bacteriophage sp.]